MKLDLATVGYLNRALAGHRRQLRFWRAVSAVGGPTSWRVLTGVTAVVLFWRRRRRAAALVGVTMAGAAMLSGGTKALVGRSRPVVTVVVDRAPGKSFPSGHALTSFVAVGRLVLLVWPACSARQRALLLVAATLLVTGIGFSRLALGVHFLTDVLGGWLMGGLWLIGSRRLVARWGSRGEAVRPVIDPRRPAGLRG
ncbi:MAG TPA: phosphatase PAP2 family protein [Jatrophihabitans sp.]